MVSGLNLEDTKYMFQVICMAGMQISCLVIFLLYPVIKRGLHPIIAPLMLHKNMMIQTTSSVVGFLLHIQFYKCSLRHAN